MPNQPTLAAMTAAIDEAYAGFPSPDARDLIYVAQQAVIGTAANHSAIPEALCEEFYAFLCEGYETAELAVWLASRIFPAHADRAEELRQATIAWLVSNDPNGCYRDDECVEEGLPVLTLDQAIDLMRSQTNPDDAS